MRRADPAVRRSSRRSKVLWQKVLEAVRQDERFHERRVRAEDALGKAWRCRKYKWAVLRCQGNMIKKVSFLSKDLHPAFLQRSDCGTGISDGL